MRFVKRKSLSVLSMRQAQVTGGREAVVSIAIFIEHVFQRVFARFAIGSCYHHTEQE